MATRKDKVEKAEDEVSLAADQASDASLDAKDPESAKPVRKAAAKRARSAAGTAKTKAAKVPTVDAEDESRRAAAAAMRAASDADEDDPLLDTAIRQIEAGATEEKPFGEPGRPVAPRSPFRIAFSAAFGVALAYGLLNALVAVRQILILILIAAFLAIGFNPVVEWFQRRGLRRNRAVLAVFAGILLAFIGFGAAVVPPIANQGTGLFEQLPEYGERLRDNKQFANLDDKYDLVEKLQKKVDTAGEDGIGLLGGAFGVVKGIFNAIFSTLTVLILTLYFLSSYPNIKRSAYRVVPRSRRPRVGLLADEILSRVGGYVLGNIATSLVAGVVAFIYLLIAGVPYPVALAVLVAFLDLIPLIGASLAALACVAVAFFVSVPVGLITAAFFLIYQQFENYVLVPRVMQRTVDVSPITTVVAVLVGGSLLGVVGALLAIPVAAAVQLIGNEVVLPRQDAL
ncbi:MAG TPA: AI-2E family transporter [Mycobacteriales bacterium]|nr:AI-2E family transporter [Mycobacteriales bacterium]